ncbi:filamin-A, partial [Elysia marginata]
MSVQSSEDQWIAIQTKTFANWANEQLRIGNRSVEDLTADLSDGVRLVALVEALQFRKIGKVYQHPKSRIQMLHNVSLALQAVAEDNVRLVNIGNDDIVDANLKLTLGLLWHLILRYQISGARASPRKLMLSWFRSMLPGDLDISNLTSSWRDGRALHALLDHCKPGLSPNWRNLKSVDAISNCQKAMQLAKEKLGIPRVISAEDFASPDLDELSAMTYLSYFIRKNSPGYKTMLDWIRTQLKTLSVTNFTTDWNNGQVLCSLVQSYGGDVPGWPTLDKSSNVATCQLGLDAAHSLGVQKTISANDLADPKVDHLTVMTYISQFKQVTPRLPKAQKCQVDTFLDKVTVGHESNIRLRLADSDAVPSKVEVKAAGQTTRPDCKLNWTDGVGECSFVPQEIVQHK